MGNNIVDLDGTYLQFFDLTSRQCIHSTKVLQKGDQYCAKLSSISENILIIFGVSRIIVFDIKDFKLVQEIEVDGFIENSGVGSRFVYTMTSDEEG